MSATTSIRRRQAQLKHWATPICGRFGEGEGGAACAIAQWQIVVIGVVLVLVILVFGGPFEKAIGRRWPGRPGEVSDQPPGQNRLRLARRCKRTPLSCWRSA